MRPQYRPRALADLDAIAAYSRKRWDEEQARAYLQAIRKACEMAARFPRLGRASIVAGYRLLTVESHVIYYRELPAGVVIVRVLHQRQSPGRRLPARRG